MGNFDNSNIAEVEPNTSRAKVIGLSKAYTDQIAGGSRIYDPLIIDRLNQYLNENKDQAYVDINVITEALRRRYREYRRRNWNDFKRLVERSFAEVSKKAGLNVESSGSSSSSEVEECDTSVNVSNSNAQVTNLYKKQDASEKRANDMELINLSSDEEPVGGAGSTKINSRDGEDGHTVHDLLRDYPDVSVSRRRRPYSSNREGKTKGKDGYSNVTFSDFGGSPDILEEVCKLILHIKHPEVFRAVGISAPRGFLLHGPPGCGKTLLACAIAGELRVPFIKVSGPELVGGVSGESEERIRELFSAALDCAPCVLFIDEVDAVTPNRQTAQREMERRIVAQLLTSLDDLTTKDENGQVLVIGATKRPDSLDPALRRAGRFDREVSLGIPNEKARGEILKVLCAKVPLSQELDYASIARMTPGFVGADLLSLIRESAMAAITRAFEQIRKEKEEKKNRKRKLASKKPANVKKANISKGAESEIRENSIENVDDAKSEVVISEKTKSEEKIVETVAEPMDTDSAEKPVEKNGNEEAGENGKTSESKDVVTNGLDKGKAEEGKQDADVSKKDKVDEKVKESASMSVDIEVDLEQVIQLNKQEIDVVIDSEEEIKIAGDPPQPVSALLEWVRQRSFVGGDRFRNLRILQSDLMAALKKVQPSAKREGFATVPDVTWEDVGSLVAVRDHLKMTILGPIKYEAQFERLGLVAPAGVLLCGPPGCGKTLLAKAVANEAGINFISVKGPELLNMYVGESERAVRTVFQRARNSSPCVIFFDELDALCPRRCEGDAGAGMRVVNQMLTEMDGVGERRGVFLMAATNRPDIVDPAVLRPGRLDKTVFIGVPTAEDRKDILRALTKNGTKPPLANDVCLDEVALRPELENWTGADLAALMREAAMQAVREQLTHITLTSDTTDPPTDISVSAAHVEQALKTVRPSISSKDLKRYEEMRIQFTGSPGGT